MLGFLGNMGRYIDNSVSVLLRRPTFSQLKLLSGIAFKTGKCSKVLKT